MNLPDPIASVLNYKGRQVHSIRPDDSIFDALAIMAEKKVGALLVMDGRKLAGIVSERDYARKVVLHGKSSKDTPVSEIMTSEVVCVTPKHSVADCMEIMTENRIRHLPVMVGEEVEGIVSIGDLVNWIISAQEDTIRHLEAYITGSPH